MEDNKTLNYLKDVLKNMPTDWLSITTHRLDIYNERLAKTQFIDQLVESLTLDIIHVLQDNVVDMKANSFLRDLGITIECIKSLIKRDFGQHHPMHIITDSLLSCPAIVVPNANIINVTNSCFIIFVLLVYHLYY